MNIQKLKSEINKQMINYPILSNINGITELLIKLAHKESHLNVAFEQVNHLKIPSFGVFNMKISDIHFLGMDYNDIKNNLPNQIKCMLRKLSFTFQNLENIKNPTERLKFALASYLLDDGKINRIINMTMNNEEIIYEGINTEQGKWCFWEYSSQQLYSITTTITANEILAKISYIFSTYNRNYEQLSNTIERYKQTL